MSVYTDRRSFGPTLAAVRVEQLVRTYGTDREPVTALAGVDATFHRGTFTAVMGPSGSGKSTLLQTAAGLDRPTSGRVWLGDTDLSRLSETNLTKLRRTRIGFVFQAFNLIGALTVEENIVLPLRLSGARPDQRWLAQVVERVGLADRLRHRPSMLSGGQQQRVAIARALAMRPEVIFSDEPTGALDHRAAHRPAAADRAGRKHRAEGVAASSPGLLPVPAADAEATRRDQPTASMTSVWLW